jgi:hypothetical protein
MVMLTLREQVFKLPRDCAPLLPPPSSTPCTMLSNPYLLGVCYLLHGIASESTLMGGGSDLRCPNLIGALVRVSMICTCREVIGPILPTLTL